MTRNDAVGVLDADLSAPPAALDVSKFVDFIGVAKRRPSWSLARPGDPSAIDKAPVPSRRQETATSNTDRE